MSLPVGGVGLQAASGGGPFVPLDGVVPAASRILTSELVSTDTQPAFRITGDGSLYWGPGGSTASDVRLYRNASGTLVNTSNFLAVGGYYATFMGSAGLNAFVAGVSGDPNPRLQINAAGVMSWGPGSAVADTTLQRVGVNYLQFSGPVQALGAFNANALSGPLVAAFQAAVSGDTQNRFIVRADGNLFWGPGNAAADTSLYRSAANTLATAGAIQSPVTFQIVGAASGINAYQIQQTGDTGNRYRVISDGTVSWGSGTGPVDTNLYRSAAGQLTIQNVLIVDLQTSVASVTTARTGGAAATLPAAPVKYLALRDETGARVYVPAYS